MFKTVLLAALVGWVATGWTIYFPITRVNAPDPLLPVTIRIDNIPLYKLDAELQKLDLPAHVRQQIIEQQQEDRKHPLQKLEPRASDAAPDGFGLWLGVGCGPGQGCTITWKCAGLCQGQWFEISGGPTNWVGFPCPARLVCTMISRVPSIPIPRHHWTAFRGFSGIGNPLYEVWICFWQA
jgi:hypothetical protein